MLALIRKSDSLVLQEVMTNSRFTIGTDVISPAEAGWENEDYRLAEILPADLIPVGEIGVSQSVVVTDGVPKYVWTTSIHVIDSTDVDVERDARISTGFKFFGKSYAMDEISKARIAYMATLAGFAVGAGAAAGNYRWHGGDTDFVWIADDNSLNPMDAPTVFAFGQAAATWEMNCIFAARALKDTSPIPTDYQNPSYWPT